MNNYYRLLLSLCFVVSAGFAFSHTQVAPPDSTSALTDKAAAVYMIEEAKTMYGEGNIRGALIKFRQASVRDPYNWKAVYWISKCHYRMNNYGYALEYGEKAIELGGEKVNNEVYYTLGLAYHRMGSLDTAIINYQKAIDLLPAMRSKELYIQHNIDQCNFAKEQLKSEPKYTRTLLAGDINSGYDDYNVVLTSDSKTIYFTSRRSNTTGGGINPDDQRYFEDTYKCTFDEEMGEWDEVTNELGKLNGPGFDALNYISADGLWGIMTLNTTMTDAKKTTRVSDICEIKMNNKGTWNTPKPIVNKSINTSFFEGSATLTADGNTMYFVTDRKGEKSSTDIYVVEKVGKKWGTAKPLPQKINTYGRETTPYITPDGQYLFFSSNGLDGMGGLDVYVVKNNGDSWSDPVNLGAGINTVNDDTHFVYSAEMKKAFIAGFEIIGNKASIDLYEIDMSNFVFPQ